jgi:hypothetical protein
MGTGGFKGQTIGCVVKLTTKPAPTKDISTLDGRNDAWVAIALRFKVSPTTSDLMGLGVEHEHLAEALGCRAGLDIWAGSRHTHYSG